MKAATRIIGFLLLDEGKPVRNTPSGYVNFGRWPVAIFTARKDANRLRYILRNKYFNQANEFNPNEDANTKRVFELWKTRAESVSVQRAQWHEPTGKKMDSRTTTASAMPVTAGRMDGSARITAREVTTMAEENINPLPPEDEDEGVCPYCLFPTEKCIWKGDHEGRDQSEPSTPGE